MKSINIKDETSIIIKPWNSSVNTQDFICYLESLWIYTPIKISTIVFYISTICLIAWNDIYRHSRMRAFIILGILLGFKTKMVVLIKKAPTQISLAGYKYTPGTS